MTLSVIIIIAFALAFDAFSVALVAGVTLPHITPRHTFRLSWHFGFFQSIMNIIGWGAGLSVRKYIENVDHWIAFILLLIVGVRMIWEALAKDETKEKNDPTRGKNLVMLSFATSIDSLAVGLSFSILKISIWLPAIIIGVIAAGCTATGIYIGHWVKKAIKIGSAVEVIGGLVLIGIGLKILQEHGVFNFFTNG